MWPSKVYTSHLHKTDNFGESIALSDRLNERAEWYIRLNHWID